ncbi:MAG TPA: NAD(P)-dependent glycerol-3-phosphate dehydrogenase [Persephonella sp.]|uniref:Glycerol-3-phosphate dehydrogenase [NAD(P)+] n=1 Tax=Persephonella marina (strain DSM 14350 / EX-H1) TaxID=123214 RepID=C0QRF4_PERMH|nr:MULTISPECIES: NAD(P)H-dependent glycerol-3-phosphate dehydrogenase [Persephonella]ACO04028.1 glycerol-3-phosphate dehydrogenase [NAD(P)+] (NAD(P)H-dependent glycerol-3-phosphate dehydrogenase) (NAD(P)H-dependentdihydroxyacetone-phosphate reductase) [Persephonella marina EX-H1]HCB68996.1 NAD(P)-dependent glycerol-3-phosphate dehydrogenase [Persephonella sp.]
MVFEKLTVLGAGSWGTALAQAFSKNFSQITLWGRDERTINEINSIKKNSKYLPDITLSENIRGCTDINEAVKDCDILIVAVPTQSVREVLKKIKYDISIPVISASKGIEINTLKLISDIIKEVLGIQDDLIFALSGPSFAKEVALGLPTAVTLAGNIKIGEKLQEKLNTETFRLYITEDIIGAEIGGAVKNVIAIATGASDGLGLGNNARASLITRGLYEMTKVAKAFGGKPETLYGLAGLGDLVLTATGELSRNRRFGILLGKGYSVEEALKEVGQVVEGVKTVEALKKIQEKFGIELPISEVVYQVVYEGLSPKEAVRILMSRQPKKEGF